MTSDNGGTYEPREPREPRDPRQKDDPRDMRDIREGDDPRDPRDPRKPGDERDPRRPPRTRLLGFIGLVLSGVMFVAGAKVGYELVAGDLQCINDYANKSADSQVKRAALNTRDSNAKTELLSAIAEINTVSEEATEELVKVIREADSVEDLQEVLIIAGTSQAGDLTDVFAEFTAEMKAIETERAENPIPDPPREVCR